MTGTFDERRIVALGLFALAAIRLITASTHSAHGPTDGSDDHGEHRRALEVGTNVVAGLATGDTLAGLQVDHVGEPRDGAVAVELTDGAGGGVRIWVRARARVASPGQAQTDDFDIAYGNPRPGVTPLSRDVSLAATEALAERISQARPDVPDALR